jgi:UDP-glucose 4-epimerase
MSRGPSSLVNIGTGKLTSIEKLWSLVGSESTQNLKKASIRSSDLTRCSVSPVRAKIALGWEPWTDLAAGIAELKSVDL